MQMLLRAKFLLGACIRPSLLCGILLLASGLANAAAPAELPPIRIGPKSADATPERHSHPQPTVPDGDSEIPFD